MVVEGSEMPNGWPLGLGSLNLRLRATESSLQPTAAEPRSLHAPSSSFSSFSSSDLDTQSTASFFQDNSVSLGRLIGIRSRDRGVLYFPNTSRIEPHETVSGRRPCTDVHRERRVEMSRGICVPLVVSILVKMSRSKSNSRQRV